MKIMQVSPFLGEQFGGTERFCWNLSKRLSSLGNDIMVYTSKTEWGSRSYEQIDGVNIHRYYAPKVVWGINPLSIILPAIIAADIDLMHIHSYLYFSSIQGILGKYFRSFMKKKTPIIMHLHGGIGTPDFMTQSPLRRITKKLWDKIIGRLSMTVSDRTIAVSNSDAILAEKHFHIPRSKISIVPNAVDSSQFLYNKGKIKLDDQNRRRIVFIGDLETWKGVEFLLEGFRLIHRIEKSFVLEIIGQGKLRDKLERKAKSYGLPVIFRGQIPHRAIPNILNGAYSLILPSLWEGLPTVILEAMASGIPVIASHVGGIPEVITDTVTGQIIHPNNPEEIMNAVFALENEDFRKKTVKSAYSLIKKKFDIIPVSQQILRIYKSVLSRA